jgi:hypothetical protein
MPNLCFCIRWDLLVTKCILVCLGTKRDRNIFHARVGLYKFDKKQAVTRYTERVFSHSVGSMGHVVHSCVSRA